MQAVAQRRWILQRELHFEFETPLVPGRTVRSRRRRWYTWWLS